MKAVRAAKEKGSLPIAIMLDERGREKNSQTLSLFQKNRVAELDISIKNINIPHKPKMTESLRRHL